MGKFLQQIQKKKKISLVLGNCSSNMDHLHLKPHILILNPQLLLLLLTVLMNLRRSARTSCTKVSLCCCRVVCNTHFIQPRSQFPSQVWSVWMSQWLTPDKNASKFPELSVMFWKVLLLRRLALWWLLPCHPSQSASTRYLVENVKTILYLFFYRLRRFLERYVWRW